MSAPSAPQLVFEGPDPERLLLEAWSIHGTQVRITEPVIVRRGGIGGFFAKEHYRIEVLPAAPVSAPEASPVPRPAPAAAYLDALTTNSPQAPPAASPAGASPFEQLRAHPGPAAPAPATSWALAELVASTEDEVNLHTAPQPSFEEILGKVAGSLGDDPVALDHHLPADPTAAPVALPSLHDLLAGDPLAPPAPVAADPITAVTPVIPPPPAALEAPAAAPTAAARPAAYADDTATAAMTDAGGTSPALDPSKLSSTALDRPVVRARPWTLADAALGGPAQPAAEATASVPAGDLEAMAPNAEVDVAVEAAVASAADGAELVPTEAAELALAAAAPPGRHARRADPMQLDNLEAAAKAATPEAAPRGRHARRSRSAEPTPSAEQAGRPRHAKRDVTAMGAGTSEPAPAATGGADLATPLAQIGFPESLVAGAPSAPRTLSEAFELAPTAAGLPHQPGSLVAVVGSPMLARAVAELVGLAPDEVARARRGRAGSETASHLVAQDAVTAAELAPTWRRGRVGVVAVAVGSPLEDGPWAATMLQAMRPTVTLAAASATMKPDDVRAFCAMLGGVDALAVEDLEATLSPASALETGIPVAMLEGRPADAGAWVAAATWALARRSAAGA